MNLQEIITDYKPFVMHASGGKFIGKARKFGEWETYTIFYNNLIFCAFYPDNTVELYIDDRDAKNEDYRRMIKTIMQATKGKKLITKQ